MDQKRVGFTIDAGLIQRLGYELVGRAETAVSELIKNAYDADARNVNVYFKNSNVIGGALEICDDGLGMDEGQLINGFMRISSSDKIHNPISPKYKRQRAGRKGIGRFATQRLGEELVIITQTANSDNALKITIDWNSYISDADLTSITFPIEVIPKLQKEGTILRINKLRDVWTIASIKRVYRYVIDLFQPNYLSDRIANDSEDVYFKTNFYKQDTNDLFCEPIFNEQISIFDKALATFEGYTDREHIGHVLIKSESLELDDVIDIVGNDNQVYIKLSDVHFKIYYFIYNRPLYYGDRITNQELNSIQNLSLTASGVRLYRNGFRVLPYGEATDDWTKVDRRWSSDSGVINVPLSNKNLFGFVEIQDSTGMLFEETSSREGLIENEAFNELSDFVHKSLVAARQRLASALTRFKKRRNADILENDTEKDTSINEKLDFLDKMINDSVANLNNDNQIDRNKRFYEGKQIVHELRGQLEELSMLRVLAGLGLSIGEFTHEIKQYRPSIYGQIHQLLLMSLSEEAISRVNKIKYNFDNLFVYTDYFRKTITQNLDRRVESIDILEIIDDFKRIIKKDADQFGIKFDLVARSFDMTIIPMHRSEWSSILYNLYSNAKKAIVRAKKDIGIIRIVVGNLNDDTAFIDFEDNGDGIPKKNWERVFDAFFTTTSPASFGAPTDEQMVGTGLGLKIVKDIIVYYKGKIYLVPPENNFSTCFRIELPKQ